jgi:hypothetical protein
MARLYTRMFIVLFFNILIFTECITSENYPEYLNLGPVTYKGYLYGLDVSRTNKCECKYIIDDNSLDPCERNYRLMECLTNADLEDPWSSNLIIPRRNLNYSCEKDEDCTLMPCEPEVEKDGKVYKLDCIELCPLPVNKDSVNCKDDFEESIHTFEDLNMLCYIPKDEDNCLIERKQKYSGEGYMPGSMLDSKCFDGARACDFKKLSCNYSGARCDKEKKVCVRTKQ